MAGVSYALLLTFGAELVPGVEPVPNLCAVFTRSEVTGEVTGAGEERPCPGHMEEAGAGEPVAGKVTGEDGEPVASTERGLVRAPASGPLLVTAAVSECADLRVPAEQVPACEAVAGVSGAMPPVLKSQKDLSRC